MLILGWVAAAADAASDDARQQFQAGRQAFEAQDYPAALAAFEAAVAAGLSGPAVHFNIGVTAFRLEQYAKAQTAFEEAARSPAMAALAHYNLGLVALRVGDQPAAERWFSLVESEAGDERLRELATAKLSEMPAPRARDNWLGYAAVDVGYDDNVALVANSDVLGVSGTQDSFADVQLALSTAFESPWRGDAGMLLTDYQDLDTFDQLVLYGGGRYRFPMGEWKNEIGLQFSRTTLDGDGMQNERMLAMQSSISPLPGWRTRARYRFSDVDGLTDFSGLTGHRHELSADVTWEREAWQVYAEYRLDISDYDDESLSATRHDLGFELQRSLPRGWLLALEATRRHSRYDLDSNGIENWTELAVQVQKALSTRWRLNLRYTYADNDADRAEFNYRRNRISAGVEALL